MYEVILVKKNYKYMCAICQDIETSVTSDTSCLMMIMKFSLVSCFPCVLSHSIEVTLLASYKLISFTTIFNNIIVNFTGDWLSCLVIKKKSSSLYGYFKFILYVPK